MNNFRRNSSTDFTKLIKSNDLTLNMSISTENLRRLDFPCLQSKKEPYYAVKTFYVASSEIEQCQENVNQIPLIESLSICKNPFDKLVKEEFRFQTESVKRMNMEISKGVLQKKHGSLYTNVSSQQLYNTNSQPILDIPEKCEKDIEIHSKTVEDEKTKTITKLSQLTLVNKNREHNAFAPISF